MEELVYIYLALWSIISSCVVEGQSGYLTPQYINLAVNKTIHATSTCGIHNGQPIREMFCYLAGASKYVPSPVISSISDPRFAELRVGNDDNVLRGGQNCEICDASQAHHSHLPEKMNDQTSDWWQSPPLSRGMEYNQVNITIDLGQEFHVAYVTMFMANSPRPGLWVLERSSDYGQTFQPWQYFAENTAQCVEFFGADSIQPLLDDDSVICSTEYSQIVPLENGEIIVRLVSGRPGAQNFTHSEKLQNFIKATNVRIRLLRTKTLQGHLMDLNDRNDPTITRRYFYAIKEIEMGGRCVCNGHAQTCDILDPINRPNRLLCRCEHNTCGDQCERCCPGFEQKKWRAGREGHPLFVCEPCNCHGHSEECDYDSEIDRQALSLDIHSRYEGGGVCKNCRDNTEGINCHKCRFGFFRPYGRPLNVTNVCERCTCDPYYHTGGCSDGNGQCECKPRFKGPDCRECSKGYYDYPTCKPCECDANGTTTDDVCLPTDGQCPCKPNYGGTFCKQCADSYFKFPECTKCKCDLTGSVNDICDKASGQCPCRPNYASLSCDSCANGSYSYPDCKYCDCDNAGTLPNVCDKNNGTCLCKPGFAGERCDRCADNHFGFPNCQPCDCDQAGSSGNTCHPSTGQCTCKVAFTGRRCNKCTAGYYDYPRCLSCNCDKSGSYGTTCNDRGECFCRPNFEGAKCDQCKPNFYNYPICEECNCDPKGVSWTFAGCDKVPKGELCTCKERVTGRICNECKPTFWNLQYHNDLGCEDCACNLAGTLSRLNDCDHATGQCQCKLLVGGRDCTRCKDGYYNLQLWNQFGCQPCGCDIGGSFSQICDEKTGQCRCKGRITGRACTQPIDTHYFPTLLHMQYEAEDGRTPDNNGVRFATDNTLFPDYSWRGYAVFSPIQEEIYLHVDIPKSSIYRLVLHAVNPTSSDVNLHLEFDPQHTYSDDDAKQAVEYKVAASERPQTVITTKNAVPQPFVLNPGRWLLKLKTKQRLYLDYVALLPAAYYEATILRENVKSPCWANNTDGSSCKDFRYASIVSPRAFASDIYQDIDGRKTAAEFSEDRLPANVGKGAWLQGKQPYKADITVPKPGTYVVVIDYYNLLEEIFPVDLDVEAKDYKQRGGATFHHCPYSSFCREVVASNGQPTAFRIDDIDQPVTITVIPNQDLDLAVNSISLIPYEQWTVEYLLPKPHCTRRNNECVGTEFLNPVSTARIEAEIGANKNVSVIGNTLSLGIVDPAAELVPLNAAHPKFEIVGEVKHPDQYVFIVQYYSPKYAQVNLDVSIMAERAYETLTGKKIGEGPSVNETHAKAYLPLGFCPSISGCRAVVKQKVTNALTSPIEKKFVATFFMPNATDDPIYIDYIMAVPFISYSEDVLEPIAGERAGVFLSRCSKYLTDPSVNDVDPVCKSHIFSITMENNMGALPCGCDLQGSTSLSCSSFGGQCSCKDNVIGRRCTQCKPGTYGFPDCKPCNCDSSQQCDPITGQCFCPPHVEGKSCDRCIPQAYGYDPLIGCQECNCNRQGTQHSMECDQLSGQCKCKNNVSGRQCDKCVAGFYGFPYCYQCSCAANGTTADICDQNTAQCICKENVYGQLCDTCVHGTYYLEARNLKGCSDCFCFGVTSACRSSSWRKSKVMDMEGWSMINGEGGTIGRVNGAIEATLGDPSGQSTSGVYFVAPVGFLGKKLTSYGGKLSYKIESTPAEGVRGMTVGPDVILKGHNITLEYWNAEQPAEPSEPFRIEADFLPDQWRVNGRGIATRGQLMMALNHLTALHIRASYFEKIGRARLSDIVLDTAIDDPNAPTDLATNVEQCQCPAPYKGLSCEECAEGYYRIATGPFLGTCVPCQCNGHSNRCDAATGVCFDCRDNTVGEHCEKCAVGHYGDATRGTPFDCQICACPHATLENNFATACSVTEAGLILSCQCKEGYAGDRCESCGVGFFGNPLEIGGRCDRCYCNENNDLNEAGACDTRTGYCRMCKMNTTGPYCDICSEWHYGDAIHKKNCAPCTCDQCGSHVCEHESGQCKCKTNVIGDNCDRCAPDAWGFSRCVGCQLCQCGPASATTQCDLETGQCACMPGVTGLQCDRCKPGYWAYSKEGCKKCDCEWDLSVGTVCDVNTGRCQCMPGATGPRCDQCLENFLRIPDRGCFFCDQCVHVLVDDLDVLDGHISKSENDLRGVSAIYLTNKRLARINDSVGDLKVKSNAIVSSGKDAGVGEVAKLAENTKKSTQDLKIKADRAFSSVNETEQKLSRIQSGLEEFQGDVWTKTMDTRSVVIKLRELADSIGAATDGRASSDYYYNEASRLLEGIKAVNLEAKEEKAKEALKQAEQIFNQAQALSSNRLKVKNDTAQSRERLSNLTSKLNEHKNFLDQSRAKTSQAEGTKQRATSHPFYIAGLNFESEIAQSTEKLGNASEYRTKAKDMDAMLKDSYKNVSDSLQTLNRSANSLKTHANDVDSQLNEVREKVHLAGLNAAQLEPLANRLSLEFTGTRDSSHDAVRAAQAYKNIADGITGAHMAANDATRKFNDFAFSGDAETQAKNIGNEAIKAHREALKSRSTVVNELKAGLKTNNETLHRLQPQFADLKRDIAKLGIQQEPAPRHENLARMALALESKKEANRLCQDVDNNLEQLKNDIATLKNRSQNAVHFGVGGEFGFKAAQSQIAKATPEVQKVAERLKLAKGLADRVGGHLNNVTLLLEDLKDKVARARDLANRAQFSTQFYSNSTLQLANPPGFSRSSAYTLLSFYFLTADRNAFLFFMGNDRDTFRTRVVPKDDYLLLEIVNGRVKLTYDLGSGATSVEGKKYVSDNRWHKVTVERTNKIATLTVETENEPADKHRVVASGTDSLLNLDQEASKIHIGGVAEPRKLPIRIQKNLEGQIDDVILNGQKLGLWNFADDNRRNTFGVPKRKTMRPSTTSSPGVNFNGNGYVEMARDNWNPRRETNVKLSFKTYALKGLLFFTGKGDFFAIELRDGRVVLSFNCGGGMGQIVTAKAYNDGEWHLVDVQRTGKDATMTIDMDASSTQKTTSPGTHTDLDVADVYYIGGTKTQHRHREITNVGFQGCIDKVHVGGSLVNLNSHISAIFIEPGCEPKPVQVLSIDGPGGWAEITPLKLGGNLEVTFKFKTKKPNALILWLTDEARSNSLAITLESGRLLIVSINNGGQADRLKEEARDYSDGAWHYVTITRNGNKMKVVVDDFYTRETALNLVGLFKESEKASLYFSLPVGSDLPPELAYLATSPFIGCVGDVAYNSVLLNFNNATRSTSDISLVGCPLPDPVLVTPPPTLAIEGAVDSDLYAASQLSELPAVTSASVPPSNLPPVSQTDMGIFASATPSVDDEGCALRASAVDPVDSRGYRLGREVHSRLEYDKIPGSIDKKANFSFQFRASSTNGIMFYVTNAEKTDYIAVYMRNGKLVFGYDSGSGPALLESNKTFLDHNWHTVLATREGKNGRLVIDKRLETRGTSKGATDVINVDRPFFVGGLPPEWLPSATKKHVNGIVNSFGGCLRDFQLDGIPFSEPTMEYHIAKCEDFNEKGLYFGARGGYAVVKEDFSVGATFTFELEVKPRVRNAVLLAISSSSHSDFLTVQIVNGVLKYSVNTGSTPQYLTNAFDTQKMDLCDGHWHMIKIVKVKNVMSLSIDGVTKSHTIKKVKSLDIDTKDPLYLGGVPPTYNGKGLDTKNSFVGCIRTIKVDNGKDKRRRRKQAQVHFDELTLFGDTIKGSCPVN